MPDRLQCPVTTHLPTYRGQCTCAGSGRRTRRECLPRTMTNILCRRSCMPHSTKSRRLSRQEITPSGTTLSLAYAWSIHRRQTQAVAVSAYGDRLAPLHASTWDHAVYRWMGGYWQFLVDLTTDSEEVSDLTLHVTLRDAEPPTLEIGSVHVP